MKRIHSIRKRFYHSHAHIVACINSVLGVIHVNEQIPTAKYGKIHVRMRVIIIDGITIVFCCTKRIRTISISHNSMAFFPVV